MMREFTRTMGRWKIGTIEDWPSTTWRMLSESSGMPIGHFTRAVGAERKPAAKEKSNGDR